MGDALTPVTVALDWTPNTNHLGFYYAKSLGLYAKAGLDVRFLSPNDPVYRGSYLPNDANLSESAGEGEQCESEGGSKAKEYATPCSRVAAGLASFAINSPEGVVNWNTAPGRPALKAVAAILQNQSSAIVTTKASGLTRPADLDGKVYASYAARFEGRIVQQMIVADGGRGDFEESTPPMLGIFDTILAGKADATWVFMGWEGVVAKRAGVELNAFYPQDFGVPYPYAPCLVAHPDTLAQNAEMVSKFLAASSEGWIAAAASPNEAAKALVNLAKEEAGVELEAGLVADSAEFVSTRCLDDSGHWGVMESKKWGDYIDWLVDSGLLTTAMQSRHPDVAADRVTLNDLRAGRAGKPIPRESVPTVFTNDFLPRP